MCGTTKRTKEGKEVFVSLQQVVPVVVVVVVVFTRLTRNPFVFVCLLACICRRRRCPFVLFDCFGVVSDVLFVLLRLLSFPPFKLLLYVTPCNPFLASAAAAAGVSRDLALWDIRDGTGRTIIHARLNGQQRNKLSIN